MGIHAKIGQQNHACVPLLRILHVWGIKVDYYRLHLNIVMVGFLKTFCTLKVIMVAVVQNKAKLRREEIYGFILPGRVTHAKTYKFQKSPKI